MKNSETAIKIRRLTGIMFILGAILVNIPYTLLIMNFDYPDILREPAGTILTEFQAGSTGLIWTWFAFAWVGIPLLLGIIMLPRTFEDSEKLTLKIGTTAGIISLVSQMIGLLRWTFVVPILAAVYTDPAASEGSKEAVTIVFQALHQFGGVLLGEHIGQLFTIIWMMMVSLAILRTSSLPHWIGWFGFGASFVYALGQTEILATVMPAFPVVGPAGMVGSLLWLAWMMVLGFFLLRAKPEPFAAGRAQLTSV